MPTRQNLFKNLSFLPSLLPSLIVIFGNLSGGIWVISNIVFTFALSIPDWIFSEKDVVEPIKNVDNKALKPKSKDPNVPDIILILHPIFFTFSLLSLFYGIINGSLVGWYLVFAVLSTGMNSGSAGTLSAHELIHRRNWLSYLGMYNLFLLNYSHYFVEHLQGHHPNVATNQDPSTAKRGQNFYSFFIKAVPWQLSDAWKYQTRILAKKGKVWSIQNYLLVCWSLKIVFLAFLFLLNPIVCFAFIGQALVARVIHESISYTQHYGLVRTDKRVLDVHSWQSKSVLGKLFLLELTKHSDHHIHVTRSFDNLEIKEKAPTLPCGYYGIFMAVLIPPLWFSITEKELACLDV